MKRSEFWKWLDTCPDKKKIRFEDDGDVIRICFPVDEDPEEGEA